MPYIENSENPIVDLSYNFGVRIVKYYNFYILTFFNF